MEILTTAVLLISPYSTASRYPAIWNLYAKGKESLEPCMLEVNQRLYVDFSLILLTFFNFFRPMFRARYRFWLSLCCKCCCHLKWNSLKIKINYLPNDYIFERKTKLTSKISANILAVKGFQMTVRRLHLILAKTYLLTVRII